MKKKELMDYINEFIESGILHGASIFNGDYKAANKSYKKMEKIFQLAINCENREMFYKSVLQATQDISTIIWCYLHMLRLNIDSKEAEKGLLEISKGGDGIPPILATSARMTLQEWEKGNIKPVDIS